MNRQQRKRQKQRERKRREKEAANSKPQISQSTDGLESFANGPGQTSDTRIMERAIRERWPIAPELRELMVQRMARIVLSKKSSTRETTSAYRAVIGSDRLNQLEEHHASDQAKEAKEASKEPGAAITVNLATAVQVNVAQAIAEATDEQLQKFIDAANEFSNPSPINCNQPNHAIVDSTPSGGGNGQAEAAAVAGSTPSTNGFHPSLAKPSTNGVSGKQHP